MSTLRMFRSTASGAQEDYMAITATDIWLAAWRQKSRVCSYTQSRWFWIRQQVMNQIHFAAGCEKLATQLFLSCCHAVSRPHDHSMQCSWHHFNSLGTRAQVLLRHSWLVGRMLCQLKTLIDVATYQIHKKNCYELIPQKKTSCLYKITVTKHLEVAYALLTLMFLWNRIRNTQMEPQNQQIRTVNKPTLTFCCYILIHPS